MPGPGLFAVQKIEATWPEMYQRMQGPKSLSSAVLWIDSQTIWFRSYAPGIGLKPAPSVSGRVRGTALRASTFVVESPVGSTDPVFQTIV